MKRECSAKTHTPTKYLQCCKCCVVCLSYADGNNYFFRSLIFSHPSFPFFSICICPHTKKRWGCMINKFVWFSAATTNGVDKRTMNQKNFSNKLNDTIAHFRWLIHAHIPRMKIIKAKICKKLTEIVRHLHRENWFVAITVNDASVGDRAGQAVHELDLRW